VDMADGVLNTIKDKYQTKMQMVKSMGVDNRKSNDVIISDLQDIQKIS